MTLSSQEIQLLCMAHPGMWGDFLAAGKLSANFLELEISRADFEAINRRYFGAGAPGTVLHEILKPAIAVVDAVSGADLAECGGCARRELWLNVATALREVPMPIPSPSRRLR